MVRQGYEFYLFKNTVTYHMSKSNYTAGSTEGVSRRRVKFRYVYSKRIEERISTLITHCEASEILESFWNRYYKKLRVYTERLMRNMVWRGQRSNPAHFDVDDVLQLSFLKTLEYLIDNQITHTSKHTDRFLWNHFTNQAHTYISNQARNLQNKLTTTSNEGDITQEERIKENIDYRNINEPMDRYSYIKLIKYINNNLSDDKKLLKLFYLRYVLHIDNFHELSKRMSLSKRDIHNLVRRLKRRLNKLKHELMP